MRSIFSGFNVATLAMQAQRKATDITAHNIANANTPGFSRQRAKMAATEPFSYAGAGQVGTGVIVKDIERVREQFLDYQVRSEIQLMGYWEARRDSLEKIEILFMEPSENSFNTVLGRFFDSWHELSINPESSPVRTNLIENSVTLINTVNHLNSQLDNLKKDTNEMIRIYVHDINNMTEQIANLNQQIVRVTARGESPNDLMDRRDLLLDQLSETIDFTEVHQPNGSVNLIFRGKDLVRESNANGLLAEYTNGSEVEIYWAKDGQPHGGGPITITRDFTLVRRRDALEGLDSVRQEIDRFMEDFDALVSSIAELVNECHQEGFDLNGNKVDDAYDDWDGSFFQKDALGRWVVSSFILNDVSRIAAAFETGALEPEEVGKGNGLNALRIAQMRSIRLVKDEDTGLFRVPGEGDSGQTTFESFYRGTISVLGVKSQESIRMVQNQQSLLNQLLNRRESVSGVSLDEEMSNLIMFQHAYQAAARVVTTLDSMLDTVINRMGVR